jgi:hypothetical protein
MSPDGADLLLPRRQAVEAAAAAAGRSRQRASQEQPASQPAALGRSPGPPAVGRGARRNGAASATVASDRFGCWRCHPATEHHHGAWRRHRLAWSGVAPVAAMQGRPRLPYADPADGCAGERGSGARPPLHVQVLLTDPSGRSERQIAHPRQSGKQSGVSLDCGRDAPEFSYCRRCAQRSDLLYST